MQPRKKSRMYCSISKNGHTKVLNVFCLALLLVLVLGLSPYAANGLVSSPEVEWQKPYGNLEGNSVLQTSDGGYLVGGEIKTDSLGNVQWNKTYGASLNFSNLGIWSVMSTKDDGYAFWAANSLVKTNSNGDIEWSINTAKYLSTYCALQTNDGGYLLVGYLITIDLYHPFGILTACLYKLNSNGATEWNKTYEEEVFFGATVTDSGFALIGKSRSTSDNYLHVTYNFFLMVTDFDGNVVSQKNWGQYALQGIAKTDDGLLLIRPDNTITKTDPAGNEIKQGNTITKTDPAGNETWSYTYERPNLNDAINFNSVSATNDGGCVILGTTALAQNTTVIVKLDSNGNLLWDKTFNETSVVQPENIISTSDGGIAFTYYTNGNIMLTKLKPTEPTPSPTQTENTNFRPYTILGIAISTIIILAVGITVVIFMHRGHRPIPN